MVFLFSAVCWSGGAVEHLKISNSKHQMSAFQVSGDREVSGVSKKKRKSKELKPEYSYLTPET
jgi:hypothetical protein